MDAFEDRLTAAELVAAAEAMGVGLSAEGKNGLLVFLRALLVWRRRVALVSQRTAKDIIAKHVADALAVVRLLGRDCRLADLGTGAGFPGMIVGLVRRRAQVVLVESKERKVAFLLAAARETGAHNVRVVHQRAEDLVPVAEFRGAFDVVVSRAVWSTRQFLAYARPLLHAGGVAIAMKGPAKAGEGTAAAGAGGYHEGEVVAYELPQGEKRRLLLFRRCFT